MKKILLILVPVLSVISCGAPSKDSASDLTASGGVMVAAESAPMALKSARSVKNTAEIPEEATAKKIIKDGSMGIKVRDIREGKSAIDALVAQYNAYYGNESYNDYKSSVAFDLTVRIPSKDYENFIDLLFDIHNETSLNSRQLDILIKIDYFSMIGNSKELLKINEVFEFFNCGEAKSIKKDKVSNDKTLCNIIKKYSTDKTKSGKESKNYSIIDMKSLLYECESYVKNTQIKDFDIKNKIAFQNEFLGYVSIQTDKEEDRKKLIIMDIFPLINKSTQEQFGYRLITRSIGSGKQSQLTVYNRTYKKNPILKSDIITADSINKNKRGYWELISYQKIC